ncbi:DUF956 family protein [Weissella koreensis]|uniref:DUF956 family protein n=1 Tax=Weissella koreensis TaxID=165096 RepID=A0A7H1MKU9_9LACO|nr:DUF956 family protein [Weissella koreensis]AEJ23240.1 ManO [Weissella koreensis KACC 15510]AVH74883.1 DUF956 domain-containing protein [Weissella koreensis]EJF33843.1 ManO [Weissella koreensis KCTC 3621]MCZ9310745.1 DUF956 family protein [Weissella koreensis]QGN20106.1 DUF956 family protein [Weissella koreensis]
MVESINTRVELKAPGISYLGIGAKYGDFLIGDNGFEFFNTNNVNDFIQIPWEEMKVVYAQLHYNKKLGRRFKVITSIGDLDFSSKEVGAVLKTIRQHIGNEKVLRRQSFWKQMTLTFKSFFTKNK